MKLRLHYYCMINDGNCTDKLSRVSDVCRLCESDTAANENNRAHFPFTKKETNWNLHATPVLCLAAHFESGTQI